MNGYTNDYSELVWCLRFVKFLYDMEMYDEAVGDIKAVSEGDYYELVMRGLEHAAPEYYAEELGEEVCCGGHVIHHFSSPVMREYYRLCRLYEHKHGIDPEENPYVKNADANYGSNCCFTGSSFFACYDDDTHTKELNIEVCPEQYCDERDMIMIVREMMDFYDENVEQLRMELLRGPIVYLPALPEHIAKGRIGKRGKQIDTQLKKAG